MREWVRFMLDEIRRKEAEDDAAREERRRRAEEGTGPDADSAAPPDVPAQPRDE